VLPGVERRRPNEVDEMIRRLVKRHGLSPPRALSVLKRAAHKRRISLGQLVREINQQRRES
jgi:hypothetical protein